MEVERHTEVRLATWLCEAIGDTIHRFRTALVMYKKWAEEDQKQADEVRSKQTDHPILSKVYNPQQYQEWADNWRTNARKNEECIDELLVILQQANALKERVINFWTEFERRYKENRA